MAFIIGTILALIFLEGPWQWVAIAFVASIELFEISIWLKWRKVRATTGRESFVGLKGKTLSECRPEGQVRVKGQTWKAYCKAGIDSGQEIVVEGVEGLRLTVAPVEAPAPESV